MKSYDSVKTEEILKNLKDDGIEVKDLSGLFCKSIIGVRVKAGRGKMSIGIDNLKTLGIFDNVGESKDIKDFKEQNISAGAFRLFNKQIVNKFDNLIANSRQLVYRYSMTSDGTTYYMTIKNYREFKDVFETKYLSKFNESKKDLIEKLDFYKEVFENRLKEWLKNTSLSEGDINIVMSRYLSNFPTKESIERNCYMSYYTIAYPVFSESHIDGVSEDIADDILKDKDNSVIDTFYNLIGSSLSDLFEITSKMINTIDISTKEEENNNLCMSMSSRTKGLLNKTIDFLRNNNYILKNDTLDYLIYLLSRTFIEKQNKKGDSIKNGEAVMICESILSGIYNYSKYLGVDEMISKVISSSNYKEEELELLEDIDIFIL